MVRGSVRAQQAGPAAELHEQHTRTRQGGQRGQLDADSQAEAPARERRSRTPGAGGSRPLGSRSQRRAGRPAGCAVPAQRRRRGGLETHRRGVRRVNLARESAQGPGKGTSAGGVPAGPVGRGMITRSATARWSSMVSSARRRAAGERVRRPALDLGGPGVRRGARAAQKWERLRGAHRRARAGREVELLPKPGPRRTR